MQHSCRLVVLVLAIFALPVLAQQTTFTFDLDAAQVVGGSTSTAVGKAFVTLDANNLVTITIHHDVANASVLAVEVGPEGGTPTAGLVFTGITSNPIQHSFTLSSAAEVTTMLQDGIYVQILDSGFIEVIRGQIKNGFTGQVFISEWCNDPIPPAQSVGLDTNLDGIAPTTSDQNNDEFVEIVNGTDTPVVLDGWTFEDVAATNGGYSRHIFPVGTTLQPGEAITLFGGGSLQNFLNSGLQAQAANSGQPGAFTFSLGLNNGGDTMILKDSLGNIIDTVTYASGGPGDSDGFSVVKIPESPLGAPVPTNTQPFNPLISPGLRAANKFPWSNTVLPMVAYPGNGTDAAIEVKVNGISDITPTNQHMINGGDIITLTYVSPNMQLLFSPFLAVAQPFTTGFPASPASAFPGDAVATIIYSGALPTFILVDGLSFPMLPFAPVLGGFSHTGSIPVSAGGTNTSYMLLLITQDPGRNAIDLGNAEAHELIVM